MKKRLYPVLRIVAAFSRYEAALEWARDAATQRFGTIALQSEIFAFENTPFYDEARGDGLLKTLFAFDELIDPGVLPGIKNETIRWEVEYAKLERHTEPRPLNLDPGYITEAKLVLASTKNNAHRLYLADGIFGELTLQYRAHQWQAAEWTFPDYRRAEYHQFFTQCRDLLREKLDR